jgi:hypothetical protein
MSTFGAERKTNPFVADVILGSNGSGDSPDATSAPRYS